MTPNPESPAALLVGSLLTDAQQALEANDLDKAHSLFEEALRVPGNHSNRTTTIRQALKDYSDRVARQKPPDWAEAHRALSLLDSWKELQDAQNQFWQRTLWLNQADFLLGEKDLDQSFTIFSDLLSDSQRAVAQDELKGEISRIVRENFSRQASQGDLSLLNQIIERVQNLGLAGDELRLWLETIREALDAANMAAKEREQQLQQELRRRQNIIYALIVILVLTVIAYFVVVFLL